MKKCILFLSFLFIIFINLNANAAIYPESSEGRYGYSGYYPCFKETKFNYLMGRQRINAGDTFIDNCNGINSSVGGSQYIIWDGCIETIDGEDSIPFYSRLTFSGMKLQKIEYKINGDEVYVSSKQADNSFVASVNIPVDLNKYVGTTNKLFKYEDSNNYYSVNINISTTTQQQWFKQLVANVVYGYKVFENNTYDSKDLYFIVDSCNPLEEKDIINSLSVNDSSYGKITSSNIKIIDSNYEINENYVTPGEYDMTIKAWDDAGNITYQKCKILSADVTPPTITGASEIDANASEILTEEKLLKNFSATDETGVVSLKASMKEYEDNYNVVGNYDITIRATDGAGNTTDKLVKVNVQDNISPTLIYEEFYISADEVMTMADLRSHITVYDNVDGIITDYYLEDESGYFDHPHIQGDYSFFLSATDSNTNELTAEIVFYVVDNVGPVIEAPKFTVILNKGEKVTREQILNILKSSGQINSLDNVILHSLYFDSMSPEGEYDLEVEADGKIYHNILKFVEKNNNQQQVDDDFYTIPAKAEKDYKNYYIIAGISTCVIVVISVLGVVIYKKKH